VRWADDETNKSCAAIWQPEQLVEVVHQARKIIINIEARLILIDPIEGEENGTEEAHDRRLSQFQEKANA
jgi:hypothetical protein